MKQAFRLLRICLWLAVCTLPVRAGAQEHAPLETLSRKIVIPELRLEKCTLRQAVEIIAEQARQADPTGRGLNLVFMQTPLTNFRGEPINETQISVTLKNISPVDALSYVRSVIRCQIRWDEHAVFIARLSGQDSENHLRREDLEIREPQQSEETLAMLQNRKIKKIKLSNVPPAEAHRSLAEELKGVATLHAEPGPPPKTGAPEEKIRVSLDLVDLPIIEYARYLGEVSGLRAMLSGDRVFLYPPKDPLALGIWEEDLESRASEIVLPRVDFRDATLAEALELLSKRSGALNRYGFPINMILKPLATKDGKEPSVTIALWDTPLPLALNAVAGLHRLQVRWDDWAVVVREAPPGVAPGFAGRPKIKILSGDQENAMDALRKVRFQKVDMQDGTVAEACDLLKKRYELLREVRDPAGKLKRHPEVNLVLKLDPQRPPPNLSLTVENMALSEYLRYVAELADLNLTVDGFTVTLSSRPN